MVLVRRKVKQVQAYPTPEGNQVVIENDVAYLMSRTKFEEEWERCDTGPVPIDTKPEQSQNLQKIIDTISKPPEPVTTPPGKYQIVKEPDYKEVEKIMDEKPKKFLEPEGTKTFLGLTGEEIEAFTYGLRGGFKFWKRSHLKYSDVDKLDISPELKASIKKEWHYYEMGEDLPEDVVLLVLLIYLAVSGQLEPIIGPAAQALKAALLAAGSLI